MGAVPGTGVQLPAPDGFGTGVGSRSGAGDAPARNPGGASLSGRRLGAGVGAWHCPQRIPRVARSGRREVPVAEVADPPDLSSPQAESVDVERALAGLEPDSREILILRFVLDLPSREVALALGISDQAVRQRVARAKAEFKKGWER